MEDMSGKTVDCVKGFKNDQGRVHTLIIYLTDGSSLEISPSSYNYGPQELCIEER